jgi:RimJ/RimL family protein N-acetyltransferase
MTPPTLTTDRLVLRPHEAADFEPYAALMASERARHMGGPMDRLAAWHWFASDVAQWALSGHGALAVALRDGTLVGQVVLNRLPIFPEHELGWMAFDGHEGRGLIFEAARAFREWAREAIRPPSLVSYIGPDNARSVALAERLGAVRDDDAPRPEPGAAMSFEDDLIYRHWGPA